MPEEKTYIKAVASKELQEEIESELTDETEELSLSSLKERSSCCGNRCKNDERCNN